jgi:16S rRNA G966 N2-methylase RsmD
MRISQVPVDDLIPDPSNARKHSEKNLDAIKGSLAKFGQQKPIVIDKGKVVLAGNGTLEAAKALGWAKIRCVTTDLDTNTDKTAFALADNRTSELAEWDSDVLGKELQSLYEDDFDIGSIGFDIDDYISEPVVEGNTDDDAVPEVADNIHGVKRGDVYLLGEHRLLCGDATSKDDVDGLMDGAKADMVFTDPPYGISVTKGRLEGLGYKPVAGDSDISTALAAIALLEKYSKYFCYWGANYYGMPPAKGWLVWDKGTSIPAMSDVELAWTNGDFYAKKFDHKWDGPRKASELGEKRIHPTQKPVALAQWALNLFKDIESVLDTFLGSGSTLIACEKTKRKCYGMEIDPHYCSVIIQRWQDFTGREAKRG